MKSATVEKYIKNLRPDSQANGQSAAKSHRQSSKIVQNGEPLHVGIRTYRNRSRRAVRSAKSGSPSPQRTNRFSHGCSASAQTSKAGWCIPAFGGPDISHISSLWEPSGRKKRPLISTKKTVSLFARLASAAFAWRPA